MPAVKTGANFKPKYNGTVVIVASLSLMFQQDLEIHCSSELHETSWNTLAQIHCVCMQILKPFLADVVQWLDLDWVFPKFSVFHTGQDTSFFLTCSATKILSTFFFYLLSNSLWRECDCVYIIWLILLGNNEISTFLINNNHLDNLS